MKYKRFVYTPVILIVAAIELTSAGEDRGNNLRGILQKYSQASRLERIVAMWNRSSDISHRNGFPPPEEENLVDPVPSFPLEVSKCIEEHQYQITENYSKGKSIILNCFKTSLMLTILGRYLGDSSKASLKLFDGLLEFQKIPDRECSELKGNCEHNRNFAPKKTEYIRMYKKAMQKLINQRKRFNEYRNLTEEEKANQLNRIDENSQAFLTEVIKNIGNERVEKLEEEKLLKEIMDPRLVSLLDTLSRNYMVKLRFYPGVSARMMRSDNGGFTFDLEIPEVDEGTEEDTSSDESSTREIKDDSEAEDYPDEDDETSSGRSKKKRSKGDKKKKKELKKKAKKLKKVLPYLLLPMIIQLSLLPFVFKKLFFLAMKALLAGKVALILVAFNLLRNSCIESDDYRVRVEHYGYRKGEEYGAWVNRRSLPEPAIMSELAYNAHDPSGQPHRGLSFASP